MGEININKLQINEELSSRLSNYLEEYNSCRVNYNKTVKEEVNLVVEDKKTKTVVSKIKETKEENKNRLNSFLERFFYSEYDVQLKSTIT